MRWSRARVLINLSWMQEERQGDDGVRAEAGSVLQEEAGHPTGHTEAGGSSDSKQAAAQEGGSSQGFKLMLKKVLPKLEEALARLGVAT